MSARKQVISGGQPNQNEMMKTYGNVNTVEWATIVEVQSPQWYANKQRPRQCKLVAMFNS